MVFEMKDVLLIVGWGATMAGIYVTMKLKTKRLEEKVSVLYAVTFSKSGRMNLLDTNTCKEHRDDVSIKIRRAEDITQRAFMSIDTLNANVVRIMMHLKIEPERRPRGE